MTLPVLTHPTSKVTIPSTGKEILLRPMLVKDEKVLLTAKEGQSPSEIFHAIRQVLQNCIAPSSDVNAWKLTLFDIEWLYVRLASISLGSKREVTYSDVEDLDAKGNARQHKFTIDLDKVEFDRKVELTGADVLVDINGTMRLSLRWPTAELYDSESFTSGKATPSDIFEDMAVNCILNLWDGDKLTPFNLEKKEDVKAFIETLPLASYNKVREFLSTVPSIYYKIGYKDSAGNEKSMEMKGLMDFFYSLS